MSGFEKHQAKREAANQAEHLIVCPIRTLSAREIVCHNLKYSSKENVTKSRFDKDRRVAFWEGVSTWKENRVSQ